jgi:hypothetical protein
MNTDDIFDDSQIIQEVTPTRKRVVRKGRVIRKKDCPPGYRLVGGTRCVRQKARERITRKRAGRRAARKSKARRAATRRRSVKVRQRRHLKRTKFKR